MKRLVIAIAVLGVFVLYSLGVRHQSSEVVKLPKLAANNTPPNSPATNNGSSTPSGNPTPAASYKDGTYTGSVADAYYGNVQVSATVNNGKLVDVKFLQYPDTHSTSVMINQQAIPYLKQEAIQAQSSHVQIVSGATFTSQAFIQSLSSALSQA